MTISHKKCFENESKEVLNRRPKNGPLLSENVISKVSQIYPWNMLRNIENQQNICDLSPVNEKKDLL